MANDNQIGVSAVFDSSDFDKGIAEYNSAISDSAKETQSSAKEIENAITGISYVYDEVTGEITGMVTETSDSVSKSSKKIKDSLDEVGEKAPAQTDKVKNGVKGIGDETKRTADRTKQDTDRMAGYYKKLSEISNTSFSSMGKIGNAAALAFGGIAAAAIGGIGVAVKEGIEMNKFLEMSTLQFTTLMGSADLAKEHVALLFKIAGSTPFETSQIINASKALLTFGGVALDTKENILLVGDAAAATGSDIGEVSTWVGRAYSAIQSGRPFGEAAARLQEMGILSSEARTEIEKLQDSGASSDKVWAKLTGVLGKFNGAMASQSKTLEGLLSTLSDSVKLKLAPAMEPLFVAFKSGLEAIIAFTDGETFTQWMDTIGNVIGELIDSFSVFAKSGDIVGGVANAFYRFGQKYPILIDIGNAILWVSDMFEVLAGIIKSDSGIIISIITTLGLSIAAAALTAITPMLPLIATFAAVAGAVYLLYTAWTQNFGGIQEKFGAVWEEIQPVLTQLQGWLGENIPLAIEKLSAFWQEALLPAIVTVVGFWVDNVLPVLARIVQWLGTNVPVAIKAVSKFWTNTLLPALEKVWSWVNENLVPMFADIYAWMSKNIPAAISVLSNFWNTVLFPAMVTISGWVNTNLIPALRQVASIMEVVMSNAAKVLSAIFTNVLLPAITGIWRFLNTSIIPLFNAVSDLMNAVVGLAARVLAGVFDNVLLPALQGIWAFVNNNILPVFQSIGSTIDASVRPALEGFAKWLSETALELFKPFSDWLVNVFAAAWKGIQDAIQVIIDLLKKLTDGLNNLELPSWLTPGSPTPLELGLLGINKELESLANATLPAVRYEMSVLGTVRDVQSMAGRGVATGGNVSTSNQSTRNYLFGSNFNVSNQSGLLEIMSGLA